MSRHSTLTRSIVMASLAVGLLSEARADVAPPVEIRMPLDARQAVSSNGYAGVFEVEVYRAGRLADFKLGGEGWTTLSFDTATKAGWKDAGVVRIPFQATPADADKPIRLSLTYNGRLVTKTFEIGPAYFAPAGAPYHSVQVHASGRPAAEDAESAGQNAGTDTATGVDPQQFDGPIQVVGRIVYSRPGRDLSWPRDGDYDDPEDVPPATVGADKIDVRIWDSDTIGHETIWSGYTDENGYFDTGVVDWEDSGDDPDLVLYYETEIVDVVDVTDNSIAEWTYTFESDEVTDFTGSYYDFGTHSPADSGLHPALHIFNSVVRTRRFITEKPGYATPTVQVEWPDDSKDGGAWYEDGPKEIHISTARQWRNDTVSHEYGHHFMHGLYQPDPPDLDYCADPSCDSDPPDDCGHCMWCQETDIVAWFEGWPHWLADVVTRDYPQRYGYDALYTRSQEHPETCGDSELFEDPIKTEGSVAALLRDIDDLGQDDHDDDPDPSIVSHDGIFDLLCLGPNEIFLVMDIYEPFTVTDFINGFLASYPQHTDRFWATAFNVGGSAYVSGFPTDTQPPGIVPFCNSTTHPIGVGGSLPCITFAWSPAPDDVQGACAYSFLTTPSPSGIEPDEIAETVTPAGDCMMTGTVSVWELGQHYFSIKARDNAGNWSSQWETFGPFEIIDCNGSGILDACDISCSHTGIPGLCTISSSPCPGLPGCGLSDDCQPNLVPDECDIANGTSQDCNLNAVPDECENMYHWDGTSGSWHSNSNWYEGEPPVTDASVCIDVSGDQTVTYSTGSLQIESLACSERLAIEGASYPCTLAITGPSFVRDDLRLSNNNTVLQVDGQLGIDGLFEWTGSYVTSCAKLTGAGTTYANGGIQIADVVHLDGHHLILDGNSTSVSTTGRVDFITPAVFEIRPGSTYEHQGSGLIFNGWFGDSFVNGGTLIKSVDSGSSSIYMFTDNSGLIHAQAGTLKFHLGSSSTGEFRGDVGATLDFSGGGHEFLSGSSIVADNIVFSSGASGANNVRGSYNVTTATTTHSASALNFTSEANIISYGSSFHIPVGTVNFNANIGGTIQFDILSLGLGATGTANFNSGDPVQVANLSIGPGTVTGPSDVTVTTLLTWKASGHFQGPSLLNVDGDLTVEAGGGAKTLYNRTLNNAGTATFLGSLGMEASATFNNLASGVIDIQADSGANIIGGSGVGGTMFNNAGTMVKTAGPGTSTISAPTSNCGTVEIQTGVLEFYTYYGSYYKQTAGQTVLNGGDLSMLGSAPVQIDGGLLTGAGTITGNVVNAGGTSAPGLPLGQLDVDGAYMQGAGAAVQIEIGGEAPGQFDKVVCTGTATLAGTLDIVLTGGFQPQPGDYFKVLSAGAVVGTFGVVVGADLPGEDDFTVIYTPNAVILGICPLVAPDFDGDCDVDGDDYDTFETCASGPDVPHSGTPTCETADFDEDNDVDQSDFGVFQRCYSGEGNPADPACAG